MNSCPKNIYICNPSFFKFNFNTISPEVYKLLLSLSNDFSAEMHKTNSINIIKLMEFVLFVNNKKINHLTFYNINIIDFEDIFNQVYYLVLGNKFYAPHSEKYFLNTINLFIENFNKYFKTKVEIKGNLFFDFKKHEKIIKIINGVKYKRTAKFGYLNLLDYYLSTKDNDLLKIIDILTIALNKKEYGLILVKYFNYLAKNKILFLEIKKENLSQFMFNYFEDINSNNQCILKGKLRWNLLVEFLVVYFDFSFADVFKVSRSQKDPQKCNIKQENGKYIKTKLITEIPLEVCDDKAIAILKKKIKEDLNLIKLWSDYQINKFEEEFIKNKKNVKVEDFNLSKSEFVKKYPGVKLLNKTVSMAIISRLIIEHPILTESFIRGLTVKSIFEYDNGVYLIGDKARKGYKLAEQKFKINETSAKIIKKWISWTSLFREYFKSDNLLISTNDELINKVSEYNNNLVFREAIKRSIAEYLISFHKVNSDDASIFSNKITLTKIRATAATMIYFQTESSSKMAEVLGHENYKPKLLQHYLPEPILEYFQSRWIRIFQKGIICEALKNSDFLLQASGFKSFKELDMFLLNHMLKNVPNNLQLLEPGCNNDVMDVTNDEIFISINQDSVAALLSLRESVKKANNRTVKSEIFKWIDFINILEEKVFSNKDLYNFKIFFLNGEKIKSKYCFEKVIYE